MRYFSLLCGCVKAVLCSTSVQPPRSAPSLGVFPVSLSLSRSAPRRQHPSLTFLHPFKHPQRLQPAIHLICSPIYLSQHNHPLAPYLAYSSVHHTWTGTSTPSILSSVIRRPSISCVSDRKGGDEAQPDRSTSLRQNLMR